MKKAIVATKVGMTQIFNEDGVLTPVTVLEAGPVYVTQIKNEETDGYSAVQVGYGDIREKLVNKPMQGHFSKLPYLLSSSDIYLCRSQRQVILYLVSFMLSSTFLTFFKKFLFCI